MRTAAKNGVTTTQTTLHGASNFDCTKGGPYNRKVLIDVRTSASRLLAGSAGTNQAFQIVKLATSLTPATYVIPLATYVGPVAGENDEQASLRKKANEEESKRYSQDTRLLDASKAQAFSFIYDFVRVGSASMNVLMGRPECADMIESGNGDAVKLMKAIVATHITSPDGTEDTDLDINERRIKANRDIEELQIGNDIHAFNYNFANKVSARNAISLTPMDDPTKFALYMEKVKNSAPFAGLYFGIKMGSIPMPDSIDALYAKMRSWVVNSGKLVPSQQGGEQYVLATTLLADQHADMAAGGQQQKNKRSLEEGAGDNQRNKSARKVGLQKNGTTIIANEKWISMSEDQRRDHIDKNSVIRRKYNAQQAKASEKASEKKALLSAARSAGEYDDDDYDIEDMDSPYSTKILMTTGGVVGVPSHPPFYEMEHLGLGPFTTIIKETANYDDQWGSDLPSDSDADSLLTSESAGSEFSRSFIEMRDAVRQQGRFGAGVKSCSADKLDPAPAVASGQDMGCAVADIGINYCSEVPKFAVTDGKEASVDGLAAHPESKEVFASEYPETKEAMMTFRTPEIARGNGMLSLLSWLFMAMICVSSYMLGAMRNGGTMNNVQTYSPTTVSRPAEIAEPAASASIGSDQRILMARAGGRQRTRFDQFNKRFVVLDPGAETSAFKSTDFLTDIRECEPGSLGGIDNSSSRALRYSQSGRIKGTHIARVLLCEGAVANILSPQSAIEQGYLQRYSTSGDYYTLESPSDETHLKFGRVHLSNGTKTALYLMDLTTMRPPTDDSSPEAPLKVMAITVSQNKTRYTKREVSDADKGRRYLAVMGNPPQNAAITQLRAMKNAPVSEADIKRCFDIYGTSVAVLKANSTKKTAHAARTDTEHADEVPTQVFMEVDIMFVKGQAFLVGIAIPIDYAMGVHLPKGRGAAHLEKGIKSMVAKLKSRNFGCASIRSDNEGGIAKQSTTEEIQLLGIELPLTGAGQHCGHIERRIRWVKEKYRRLEHGLAFTMNKILVCWAVLASVRLTNTQRTSSSTSMLSPREKFMGRPFDYNLDGRVEFGAYIQMTVRDTDNTSAPRTEGCIALFSRDNLTGSVYALHIATQAIVVRDHFVQLPMPDALILHMDKLASKEGLSRGTEPFQSSEFGAPDDVEDAQAGTKTVTFKPYNQSVNEQGIITKDADRGVQRVEENQPSNTMPLESGVTTVALGGRGDASAGQSRVTVEDVEEDAPENWIYDWGKVANIAFCDTDSPGTPPQLAIGSVTNSCVRSGAALYRCRGAKQTNSIVGMGGSTALLVGEDFNNPVFESQFKAQLHHTRHWHDRDFAFVISWNRAIKTYGEPARKSIEKELQQFIDKAVWHPVSFKGLSKQQRKAIIRAKMFVTEKFFPNGDFDKIKSRLVARGDMQDRSLYAEDDTSAPTADLSSVLSIAAIAACESRYVATCDIGGAFLNADMFKGSGRTVIVKLDPQISTMLMKLKPDYEAFVGDDGHLFVELDKAMYGCIESAKLWYEYLRGVLVNEMGFTPNDCEMCAFNKTDAAGFQVTIILHVDDMMITCANKVTLVEVDASLRKRFKETKFHYGPCVPFLGMDFDYTVPGEVRITMAGMEADILATSGVDGVAKTPATEALFEVDIEKQPIEEKDQQDWFHSNVAKLLYLGKRARPEILTATTFLATRVAKADTDDVGKLRRVIRYLRGTAGRGIRLRPGALGVDVRAYVDAAYGVHMDGKSHTGVSIFIGEAGPIFVRSTKQPIVAKSSTEAELIATSDSANQVFHVRNFIIEQGYGDKPATIFQDNMSCMALLAKGRSTSMRTRHIQIRYFWVKERVDNGEAVITHMRSESMGPANALTKPLVGMQFVEERRQLTNWD